MIAANNNNNNNNSSNSNGLCRQRQRQRRRRKSAAMTTTTTMTTRSWRSPCSFSYHCFVLSFLVLLKFHGGSDAFTSTSICSTTTSIHHQQQQQKRKRLRHDTNTKSNVNVNFNVHSNSNSNTALFFFKFNDNSNKYNEGEPDLPLSRYVDVSEGYTLAPTPEDYIDLHDNQRLACIGDVHGDLTALQQFLVTAEVYDPVHESWCGGDTVLVQCGDVLDRGIEELACYRLLAKLSHQAMAAGGRVVLLIGNHEVLNAMGLFQYAYSDVEHEQVIGAAVDAAINGEQNKWRVQYVGNQPARWASYEPGGLLAHSLMRNMKVAIRVGRTVCVHAGLKPHQLKNNGGIDGMNAAFRDWITLGEEKGGADTEFGPSPMTQHLQKTPLVYNHHGQYPINGKIPPQEQPWLDAQKRQTMYINSVPKFLASNPQDPGPIWMRDYSSPHDLPPHDPTGELQAQLDETLLLLDADRMVMGHTIQQKINGALRGKAWRVDVGASKGCLGGTPEVLEVVGRREGPETVSILTMATNTGTHASESAGGSRKIPAMERMVDCYTAAAVDIM
mmetsp:Transcript_10964/g.23295  ORF Transcript_10964/g.23295 Transcript_10964/m.23295 type:complete len:558 (-) Transcript_10964:337-2010(-)